MYRTIWGKSCAIVPRCWDVSNSMQHQCIVIWCMICSVEMTYMWSSWWDDLSTCACHVSRRREEWFQFVNQTNIQLQTSIQLINMQFVSLLHDARVLYRTVPLGQDREVVPLSTGIWNNQWNLVDSVLTSTGEHGVREPCSSRKVIYQWVKFLCIFTVGMRALLSTYTQLLNNALWNMLQFERGQYLGDLRLHVQMGLCLDLWSGQYDRAHSERCCNENTCTLCLYRCKEGVTCTPR